MRKGGYTIIDLKDTALTTGGDAVTIKGIYERIEGNYRKRIVLSGLNLDDSELADKEINFNVVSTNFVGIIKIDVSSTTVETVTTTKAEFYVMTVTDEDAVTVTKYTVTSA